MAIESNYSNKREPVEEQFHDFDNQELSKRYKRETILFHKSDCAIYRVKKMSLTDENSPINAALKVGQLLPSRQVRVTLGRLFNALEIPHMTKISLIGRVYSAKKGLSFHLESNDRFTNSPRKPANAYGYVFQMELEEGSLTTLKQHTHISIQEEAVIEVQRIFMEAVLYSYGIIVNDIKDANVLYSPLKEDDERSQCDYWMYDVSGTTFFLPKIRHWIKLCDIDHWPYLETTQTKNFTQELFERLKQNKPLLNQIMQLSATPPHDAKILNMNPRLKNTPIPEVKIPRFHQVSKLDCAQLSFLNLDSERQSSSQEPVLKDLTGSHIADRAEVDHTKLFQLSSYCSTLFLSTQGE
ncbi:MAG: hypothetical protein ABSA17_02625 [Rhabdochlamydiaceae bacterium]